MGDKEDTMFPAKQDAVWRIPHVLLYGYHIQAYDAGTGSWGSFRAGNVNTLRPRQNGRHFGDDSFKRIFVNENVRISLWISLKCVPKSPINNIPTLVQVIIWRRSGDKPLPEPMMVTLLTRICVTRPQWVLMDQYNKTKENVMQSDSKETSACLIPDLRAANERRRNFVATSLIGWAHA